MEWGKFQRLEPSAKTCLAIVPLLPVLVASLYFSGSLRWSPEYPVRMSWDEIPVIRPDSSRAAGLSGDQLARALPDLIGEDAQGDTLAADANANLVAGEDPAATGGDGDAAQDQARNALPGIIQLSFNLAANPAADGMLQVRKSVAYNQQALGVLSVRIDDASRVFVSRVDMVRMFPEALQPPQSWQDEYVQLSQVRAAGIDLRYDPTADQFILRNGSAQ